MRSIEHSKAIVEMACTIGHKINNPLSSLVFSIKNLENEITQQDKSTHAEDFASVNESIERIKKFVNELIHLKNPEVVNYFEENRMIKTD